MYRVEAESIIEEYELSNCSFDEFNNNLQFEIIKIEPNYIEFDLKGSHPSLANAIRRILIAQVPTMAIEHVTIYENNTIFPDEYVAHRLGLIPIQMNADAFDDYTEDDENYRNVLNFKLHKVNSTEEIMNVTSDDLEFCPLPGQEDLEVVIKKGVVICKLATHNEVEMTMKAIKGCGEEHTKWSPVSLCSYRLMPRIILEKEFYNEDAVELQKCFSPGVIGIEDNKAVVLDARKDSLSREVLRHDKFRDHVKILRESGWFCFSIETTGENPLELVKKAIKVLIEKCKDLKGDLKHLNENYV